MGVSISEFRGEYYFLSNFYSAGSLSLATDMLAGRTTTMGGQKPKSPTSGWLSAD